MILCYKDPKKGPALEKDELASFKEKLISLKGIFLPLLLVISVLGSIFLGVATPTEAAAVGAFGSLLLAFLNGNLNKKVLMDTLVGTLQVVGSVMWVIFGAKCFANIYQGVGASQFIQSLFISFENKPWAILIIIQIVWFVLGCLMDSVSILMVASPIFIPIAKYMGFDLLWFGIFYAVNTQMGYLTPPFGVNLVVMKGIVCDKFSTEQIYRSVWPIVIIQFIGLIIVLLFPILSTWPK